MAALVDAIDWMYGEFLGCEDMNPAERVTEGDVAVVHSKRSDRRAADFAGFSPFMGDAFRNDPALAPLGRSEKKFEGSAFCDAVGDGAILDENRRSFLHSALPQFFDPLKGPNLAGRLLIGHADVAGPFDRELPVGRRAPDRGPCRRRESPCDFRRALH